MPSPPALVAAGTLALVAITASARAWAVLFRDLLASPAQRLALRGTFYIAQLTKYLPAGGVIQVASQLGLPADRGRPVEAGGSGLPRHNHRRPVRLRHIRLRACPRDPTFRDGRGRWPAFPPHLAPTGAPLLMARFSTSSGA